MALASLRTMIFGSFAFLVFWTSATFPNFPGLPVGRTAGAIVGAALMVIFQVESPDEAYSSVNLPILGLLFGTMVVSVYLERADMFKHLAHALTWRCRGGKELLIRLSFLVAISSAMFTNDTCCVVFTEFVLQLCNEHGLPPEPFLLALASSANLGSSATPIGNPQNLVIAIQSKIPFGKFLIGILPAMLLGVAVNTLLLLLMYWKKLSKPDQKLLGSDNKVKNTTIVIDVDLHQKHLHNIKTNSIIGPPVGPREHQKPNPIHAMELVKVIPNNSNNVTEPIKSPPLHLTRHVDQASILNCMDDNHLFHSCHSLGSVEDINHFYELEPNHSDNNSTKTIIDAYPLSQIDHHYGEMVYNTFFLDAMMDHRPHHPQGGTQTHASIDFNTETVKSSNVALSEREIRSTCSPRSPPACVPPIPQHHEKEMHDTNMDTTKMKWKRNVWKLTVYLVTVGMLAALLAGLNLSWSTLSAAIVLIVIDFTDAGPNLNKVSYSLLVFFSGMFITVDGFNKTGLPAALWNAIEPHARINHPSGVVILTSVVMLLSNVASNVPTVLLLGPRVAASAAASVGGGGVVKAWLLLAWASTIAGNLTLVGSAANLIVCEKARTAPPHISHHLSFWRHFRFGFPSTLLLVAIGIPLIHG